MGRPPDYFTDMLGPGEQLLAALGAPGPTIERPMGLEKTWYQLGVTSSRFLVVKMVQGPIAHSFSVSGRLVALKNLVRISRFPRTGSSSARLEIEGLGEPVVLYDIDDTAVFPFVQPFLTAWGGHVQGAGHLEVRERDPFHGPGHLDVRKLVIFLVAMVVMLWLCCGCAGLGGLLRGWLMPTYDRVVTSP